MASRLSLSVWCLFSLLVIVTGKWDSCRMEFKVDGERCPLKAHPTLVLYVEQAINHQLALQSEFTEVARNISETKKIHQNVAGEVQALMSTVVALKRVAYFSAPNAVVYGEEQPDTTTSAAGPVGTTTGA